MSSYIDFYFDIISPYSYIAHKKIQKINNLAEEEKDKKSKVD